MSDSFNISGILHTMREHVWTTAVEMLLIGLVVYWVLRFLRGTRGARLLKGIASLLIVLYVIIHLVALQFGLSRLDFLYSKFLSVASIAVIVVFQPELRRALLRLGETRLFRGFSQQMNEDVEALVESATFCSRR